MHDKKHVVRKYEVRTRLFALRDPRRWGTAIVTFGGDRSKSAPPAGPAGKPEPKE